MSKILDVGIGTGGRYLERERKRVVGLELEGADLAICKEKYDKNRLELVQANAFVGLPFVESSFELIRFNFPYTLFVGLADPSSVLWPEISRVLTSDGAVEIRFDTFKGSKRIFTSDGAPNFFRKPLPALRSAGSAYGFRFRHEKIHPEEAFYQLGTEFSGKVLNNYWKNPDEVGIWKLTATKV